MTSLEQTIYAALPGTAAQIIQKTGACRATVCMWLKRFCQQERAYIKTWRRTAGQTAPYYAAGKGESKPQPKALTGAQHSRKHYIKFRKDLERELRASAKAARLNAASTLTKPQSWLSALGAM